MKIKFKVWKILVLLLVIILAAFIIPLPTGKRVQTPNFNDTSLKFPTGFFWGSSTSAHQVEGNSNDDLTQWEKDNAARLAAAAPAKFGNSVPDWNAIAAQATSPQNYISGAADDQYNLYPADIKLMQQIGLNSYRFSIAWSRIEPQRGKFDQVAMQHYVTEIKALHAAGIEPFVTLWHRSEPSWVLAQGDWENSQTITDYTQYVQYVAKNLNDEVTYWMTFNEPALEVLAGYIQGTLPPQVKSIQQGQMVMANMIEAHKQAYQALHQINPEFQVGSTQAMQLLSGAPGTLANQLLASFLQDYMNWHFLDATKDQTDFVGIQYYGPSLIDLHFGGAGFVAVQNPPNVKAAQRSDTGTEIYPAGIYQLLTQTYQRYKKPIIITENGIADSTDKLRAAYIADHLYWVKKALDSGIPVKGYFYWSLLDNFEWDSGFWPRFGLVQVDYANNLKRTIRPSALELKKIIGQ